MSEIYFIRHGQASFGSKKYDKLSEKGVLQSTMLGNHLAALEIKFDALYSGQMERQKNTAKAVIAEYNSKGIPIPEPRVDVAFNEYDSKAVWNAQTTMMLKDDPTLLDAINMDNINKKAFQKVFSKVVERWISGEFDTKGVVTWKNFKNRVVNGLNSLAKTWYPSKRIAVFTSAGAISAAVQKSMDLSDTKTMDLSWEILNASVTRMTYNNKKLSLSGFNNVAHLELTGGKTFLTYR